MLQRLSRLVVDYGLSEYCDFLQKVARPSIEIITAGPPVSRGCSKFGGSPDVTNDFEWPHHDRTPYRFIGQVNLEHLPKDTYGLPSKGLLSFFYIHDEKGEAFERNPGYVRVFHFKTIGGLRTLAPPEPVRFGSTCTISFHASTDVPPWPWDDSQVKLWPIDESKQDAYWEMRCQIHASGRYLLGYPLNTSLAYDPTPGPEWRSLLTLNSDDNLEWFWHDGDWLVTFIDNRRLLENDYSEIRADAG